MAQDRTAPVFVKVEDYKDILDMVDLIKDRINEARRILQEINELKNEEDAELVLWSTTLKEIDKKVGGLDKTLFEPESTW